MQTTPIRETPAQQFTARRSCPSASDLLHLAANAAAITGGAALAYEVFRYRRLLLFAGAVAGGVALASRAMRNGGRRLPRPARPTVDTRNAGPDNPASGLGSAPDPVDEAGMESFPASDPPASYRRA